MSSDEEPSHESETAGGSERSEAGREPGLASDGRDLQGSQDALPGRDGGGVVKDRPHPVGGDGSGEPLEGIAQFHQVTQYAGPLPLPSDFAGFEAVLPGAADRILAMAESRQEAEIEFQRTTTRAESVAFVGAALAVSFLPWGLALLTIGLMVAGESAAASVAAIATVAAAGPQIIAAVRPKKKEG